MTLVIRSHLGSTRRRSFIILSMTSIIKASPTSSPSHAPVPFVSGALGRADRVHKLLLNKSFDLIGHGCGRQSAPSPILSRLIRTPLYAIVWPNLKRGPLVCRSSMLPHQFATRHRYPNFTSCRLPHVRLDASREAKSSRRHERSNPTVL